MPELLELNPDIDLDAHMRAFREHGLVQIPDVLGASTAEHLHSVLSGPVPWRILYTDDQDRPVHFSQDDIRQRGQEQYNADIKKVMQRAQRNVGYFYLTYPMIEAILSGWDPDHPIHDATEFINSPAFLDLGRKVTGINGITKADVHATAYGPGHFLTRHVDHGADQERRAAYVLGLTKDWQPDWGGLLLFLNGRQDVTNGYLPRFNVLTIFDINLLHTVTQVSTFAGKLRTSMTGWFRDDPPAGAPSG